MRRKILLCLLAVAVSAFLALATLPKLSPPGPKYLELYDIKDTTKGEPGKILYLRWHGNETELSIWNMVNMHHGTNGNRTVRDGDTFTITVGALSGWAEFYYDDKEVVIYHTGKMYVLSRHNDP